ncbi:hypothetical protein BGX21_008880 [Mortierella sp. AD011]|nr:hypothetical protein BGX20_008943 [Mortierella sp. AD010]KAF9397427.1 hypothetical protein BGX21_008880 [Mortierella sp. AD011]
MRGSGKSIAKDPEEMEDHLLHRTIGASRIRSHSAKYGSHKISRHQNSTSPALPSSSASIPGVAGTTASSVSSYLENLPSVNLGATPPPRPPRPPGGMLGIINGHGLGYSRSLGSSYDSPLSIHGSFNGHVRSGANLYGGKSQISGLLPAKPSTAHTRPTMSVFPIQKALEIAMKESRLLAAASSRGGSGSSGTGTGMTTGRTFVRELRRTRHARAAVITEHGPTPDISLDEEEEGEEEEDGEDEEDAHAADVDVSVDANHGTNSGQDGISNNSTIGMFEAWSTHPNSGDSRSSFMSQSYRHEHGDIRIQRQTVASFDSRAAYPGIASVQHTSTPQSRIFPLRTSRSMRNVPSSGTWDSSSELSSPSSAFPSTSASEALNSTSIPSSSSSSTSMVGPYNHTSLDSFISSSASSRTPYQSHFSPVLSSSSTFTSEPHALFSIGSSQRTSLPSSSNYATSSQSAVHAVRELLDSYPAPSPYCVDDKKRSPLHFAAASGDLELVEFLLERGVRPDCGRDIAGNMPLHLAIISNRVEVVAALLKAGADMTLASPMTHKTPLDLAESRLSYLLSRAQESVKQSQSSGTTSGTLDLHNSQIATRSSFHTPPMSQSPALLYQIRGIVNLLRPYVARQQKLQHGERQKDRQKDRSWERAEKYMRQQQGHYTNVDNNSRAGTWRVDTHSDDNFGDMEDEDEEDDDMDNEDSQQHTSVVRNGLSIVDMDGDLELGDDDDHGLPHYATKPRRIPRRSNKRMNANETELALENLMNGLSLLEANRKQQVEQQLSQDQHSASQSSVSDITDGNLADTELDPRGEQEVDDALPDLLEQVQQVLEAIKLNEQPNT